MGIMHSIRSEIDSILREEIELAQKDDPLALLDPPPMTEGDGEFKVIKGFSRETGLYIATLTGAFIYTNSDTMWARLHETDGVHTYESDPATAKAVGCVNGRQIQVPAMLVAPPVESKAADTTRELLRTISVALRLGEPLDSQEPLADDADLAQDDDDLYPFALRVSAPVHGFHRTDVSRLVLMFGRLQDVAPVRLGLFLQPVEREDPAKPGAGPIAQSLWVAPAALSLSGSYSRKGDGFGDAQRAMKLHRLLKAFCGGARRALKRIWPPASPVRNIWPISNTARGIRHSRFTGKPIAQFFRQSAGLDGA